MRSTGPILAVGAITLANDVLIAGRPITSESRVIVGTGLAAIILALIEKASAGLAVGLAWVTLATVLLTRVTPGVPSPSESVLNWFNAK